MESYEQPKRKLLAEFTPEERLELGWEFKGRKSLIINDVKTNQIEELTTKENIIADLTASYPEKDIELVPTGNGFEVDVYVREKGRFE